MDQLTHGAIRDIRVSGTNCVAEPIVQCLSVKKVGTGPTDRYRAIISDGQCFMQAMFATQINNVVEDELVVRFCLMKIIDYTVNAVKDKTIVIIHAVETIGKELEKLGEPASVDAFIQAEGGEGDANDNGQQQQQQAAPQQQTNNAGASAAAARGGAAAGRGGSAAGGRGGPRGGAGGMSNGNGRNAPGSGSGGGGGAQHPIYPIEGLSPYQNKWTIKARVTSKSDIRHWSNQKGDGKLFSFNLMDETGEIKVTAFNDQVDQWEKFIVEGQVYFLSKAKVGIAKKQFSNVNNEYEITLESGTDIQLCTDTDNVPQIKYNFVELARLAECQANDMIDVIGIVKDIGETGTITSKATQKPIVKREITIVDNTGMSVRLTLWGRTAENFNPGGTAEDGSATQPVIAFKGVRVGDFGGRSLSMMSSSTMMVDPDIDEAHVLRGWYDNQGSTENFATFNSGSGGGGGGGVMKASDFRNIGEAKDAALGTSDEPDYFCIRAQLVFVKKENMSYPACPADRCNKKVFLEEQDAWRCEKCEKTYEKPQYRYVLSGQFADFTGFIYFSCFDDVGQQLIGRSADDMQVMKDEDEAGFTAVIDKAMGVTWNLSIRAKNDTYQDQQRIRYTIIKAQVAEWSGEQAKRLQDTIDAYGV